MLKHEFLTQRSSFNLLIDSVNKKKCDFFLAMKPYLQRTVRVTSQVA